MNIYFAFDIVDGSGVRNEIDAYGLISEATFVKYVVQNDRFSRSLPIIRLSDAAELSEAKNNAIIYAFRFAVYPNNVLSPVIPEHDWFGGSERHRIFRNKIKQLAAIKNLNLLVDHSWENLPFQNSEDFISIFIRLGFPTDRLIIISNGRKLSESAHLLQKY